MDWLKVAKLAAMHGVRYRTNSALKSFLDALDSEGTASHSAADADLLAALKDALTTLKIASRHLSKDRRPLPGGLGWGWKTLEKIEAAIAKAEGK